MPYGWRQAYTSPLFEIHGHQLQLLGVDCGSMIKAHEGVPRVQEREKSIELQGKRLPET